MNISSLPGVVTPSTTRPQPEVAGQSSNTNTNTLAGQSNRSTLSSQVAPQPPMSIQEQRQTALQHVNTILTAAYEKIGGKVQVSEEYGAFEPLTAEKVANNILGFIERRLQMDVADGASQEDLAARLEAGLSGFKKGFAEASEKLEALSLLSPEVKTDIGKTYDLVTQGIDDLRAKFITAVDTAPAVNTSNPAANTKATNTKTPVDVRASNEPKAPTGLNVPGFIPASSPSNYSYGNYEYGAAREFSFSLMTKEGDKLTIKATASEGLALEAGRATQGGRSAGVYNASYSTSQSMSWQVEGDLNEEELTAINELLGRVNDLAGQFFSGNLDTAFEQAVNLGYDDTQIGKFALNLTQVEIRQVTQAYKEFEPRGDTAVNSGGPDLFSERLLPLGNFIKDLLATLDEVTLFAEPESLVAEVGEKITGEDEQARIQGARFSQFMQDILALPLQQPEQAI